MSRIEVKALPIRRFDVRPIGRRVELRISRRYADARLSQLEEELNSILSQIPGLEDLALEIAPKDGWIAFRFNEGEWVNIIPLDDLKGEKGEDGKEVSISIDGFILKWRLGTGSWNTLIDLSTLGYFKKQDFSDEFQEDGEGKMEVKEISAAKIKGKDKDEEVYDVQTAVNNLLEQSLTIDDFNSTQFEIGEDEKLNIKEGGLPIYVDNTTITGAGTQQDPYKAEGGGGYATEQYVDDAIPSDISELADDTNIIPPHLFFDDQYFSGAGTQVDPKSLRTENLPSGGGGVVKTASLTLSEPVATINVSKWDDGTAVLLTRNAQLFVQMSDTGVVNESETSLYKRKVRFRPYKTPGTFTTNFVSLLDPIPQNGMELEVQANGDNTLVWKLNLTDWYVDGMGLRFNPEGDEYNVYTSIGDINIGVNGLSFTTMSNSRYFKTGTKFTIKAIL